MKYLKMSEYSINEDDDTTDNSLDWKQTRRNIFVVFCYESLLYGMELTILEPTEYFYFKDILRSNHPVACYGLSLASGVLSSLISSLLISNFLRKYQLYSGSLLFLVLFSIFGYGLYLIPASPYLVIFGRIIAGFGKPTNLISALYTQRLYSKEDLPMRIAILSNFVTIGSIIGPCLAYLFVMIDGNLGTLHLNYGNSPGFYLGVCKLILFVIGYLLLHDIPCVSDELAYSYEKPDLSKLLSCSISDNNYIKNSYKKDTVDGSYINKDDENDKPRSKVSFAYVIWEIFRGNTGLIFIILIYFGMIFKAINSLIPVEGLKFLSWKVPHTAALSISNAIFGTLTSVSLAWCYEYTNHFLNLIGGMTVSLLSIILLITLPMYSVDYLPGTILYCFTSLLNVLSSCLIGQSTRVLLQTTVADNFKPLSEAFRVCFLEMSYFIGALMMTVVHLDVSVSGYIILVCAFGLIIAAILKLRNI